MDPHNLKRLNALRAARKPVVLVTDLGDGRDRLVEAGQAIPGQLGAEIAKAFADGVSRPVVIGGRRFFLNVALPPVRLVVIGAVHIAQSLSALAPCLDLAVEIIDPRTAFASTERFSGAMVDPRWPRDAFEDRPLDERCALVALTHDPKIDDEALIAALRAQCVYIGALGSRKTHAKRLQRLRKSAWEGADFSRIRGPVGLDIGAATPAEIALAILAELIAHLRLPEPPSRPSGSILDRP